MNCYVPNCGHFRFCEIEAKKKREKGSGHHRNIKKQRHEKDVSSKTTDLLASAPTTPIIKLKILPDKDATPNINEPISQKKDLKASPEFWHTIDGPRTKNYRFVVTQSVIDHLYQEYEADPVYVVGETYLDTPNFDVMFRDGLLKTVESCASMKHHGLCLICPSYVDEHYQTRSLSPKTKKHMNTQNVQNEEKEEKEGKKEKEDKEEKGEKVKTYAIMHDKKMIVEFLAKGLKPTPGRKLGHPLDYTNGVAAMWVARWEFYPKISTNDQTAFSHFCYVELVECEPRESYVMIGTLVAVVNSKVADKAVEKLGLIAEGIDQNGFCWLPEYLPRHFSQSNESSSSSSLSSSTSSSNAETKTLGCAGDDGSVEEKDDKKVTTHDLPFLSKEQREKVVFAEIPIEGFVFEEAVLQFSQRSSFAKTLDCKADDDSSSSDGDGDCKHETNQSEFTIPIDCIVAHCAH